MELEWSFFNAVDKINFVVFQLHFYSSLKTVLVQIFRLVGMLHEDNLQLDKIHV